MPRVLYRRVTAGLIFAALLCGCDSGPSSYGRMIRPGRVHLVSASGNEDAEILINGVRVSGEDYEGHPVHTGPVTVSAGIPFSVQTTTFAGGCWYAVAPSTVNVAGRTATVAVFDDRIWDDDVYCAAVLEYAPRNDPITFRELGEAEVVIRGEYIDPFLNVPTYEERLIPYELRFPIIVR